MASSLLLYTLMQQYREFCSAMSHVAPVLRVDPRTELRFRVFGENPDFAKESVGFSGL